MSEQTHTADPRLLEQRNGITFLECLEACLHTSELVGQWERLTGKRLLAQSPLERLIDEATGYDLTIMQEFADFVYGYVFALPSPGDVSQTTV